MSDFNPYSAPETDLVQMPEEGRGPWRDGNLLVFLKHTEFPDRCLRCNEPAEGYRLKRTLSWHQPGWYLLVFFNLIIYVLVALCVRWTAVVSAPICPQHRSSRRRAILFGWVGSLAGIGLMVLGFSAGNGEGGVLVAIGLLLFLASLLFGVLRSQLLLPKRIDKEYVWLKKVSPDILKSLPDWHGGK